MEMEKEIVAASKAFTVLVTLGALGFVAVVAVVSLFGPKLPPLFQGW